MTRAGRAALCVRGRMVKACLSSAVCPDIFVYQQQVVMTVRRFGQIKVCFKGGNNVRASVSVVSFFKIDDATRGVPTAPLLPPYANQIHL